MVTRRNAILMQLNPCLKPLFSSTVLHCVNNPLKIVLPTHVFNSQCHHLQVLINNLDLPSFQPQLGSTNTGPLGPSNSRWLPVGANITPTSIQNPPHSKILSRGYGSDHHRDIGVAVQRGNCGDTSLLREFCPAVPYGKEEWRSEASKNLKYLN